MSLTSVLIACCLIGIDGDAQRVLNVKRLPFLPVEVSLSQTYSGTSGEALIVAGGVGLHDPNTAIPVAFDTIFILEDPEGTWQTASTVLPSARWGGVSVTFDGAVVCAGGRENFIKLTVMHGHRDVKIGNVVKEMSSMMNLALHAKALGNMGYLH